VPRGRNATCDRLPVIKHPMLATLVDEPFDDDGWIFETKWDGVRAIGTIRADRSVELISRTGHDLLRQFPEFEDLARAIRGRPAVVDGEIVSLDRAGKSSFQRLQARLNRQSPSLALIDEVPATYAVFDLIHAAGRDLRPLPLAGRKALLLPWVTLLSEGRNLGTAMAAITQAAITTQRNLTANAPIPPKMAWMRTGTAYWLAPVIALRGLAGERG